MYVTLAIAIVAFFACVITSVGGGYVTFAWFNATKQSTLNLNSLIVSQRGTVASVEVFPFYDVTANGGTSTSGVDTFSKTAETTHNMGHYSLLKPAGNAVLFKATLTDYGASASNLSLSAHSNASSYLGAVNASGAVITPLQTSGNSLSSIVCFYAFSSANIVDSGNYFSVTLSTTLNPNSSKLNFVSNDSIVTQVPIASLAGPTNVVYFILDYDSSLIESIYSLNIGNSAINNVDNISSDGQSYVSYTPDFYFWIAA